jgi:hypothetical protein
MPRLKAVVGQVGQNGQIEGSSRPVGQEWSD